MAVQWYSDLAWMRQRVPQLAGLPDPYAKPWPWFELLSEKQGLVRGWLRRVPDFSSSLAATCSITTVSVGVEPEEDLLICEDCPAEARRVFASSKALKTHRMRAHGKHSVAYHFILKGEVKCPFCTRQYESTAKARDHLNYRSKGCMAAALSQL